MLKQSYHIQEEIIEWRRDFHMHPELGFRELRTSARVAEELEKLGYRVRRGVARTGVVADLGEDGGRCIAIRADMDALPILEDNDVPYKSQHDGTMHACGHDSHTAMALGAAKLLAIQLADGRKTFIDFREKAPLAATADMYLDKEGNVIKGASTGGYLAVSAVTRWLGTTCLRKSNQKRESWVRTRPLWGMPVART